MQEYGQSKFVYAFRPHCTSGRTQTIAKSLHASASGSKRVQDRREGDTSSFLSSTTYNKSDIESAPACSVSSQEGWRRVGDDVRMGARGRFVRGFLACRERDQNGIFVHASLSLFFVPFSEVAYLDVRVCVCACVRVCVCACACVHRAKSVASSDASLEYWGVQSSSKTGGRSDLSAAGRGEKEGKEGAKTKSARASTGGGRGDRMKETSSTRPPADFNSSVSSNDDSDSLSLTASPLLKRGSRSNHLSAVRVHAAANVGNGKRENRNGKEREEGAPRRGAGSGDKTQPPLQASEPSGKRGGGGQAMLSAGEVRKRRGGARKVVGSSSSDDDSSPFSSSPFLRRTPSSFSQRPGRNS